VALEVRIETLFPVSPDHGPGSDAGDDVRAGEKLAGFLETSQWNNALELCSKSFGSSSDDLYIEACGAHLSKVRKIIESNQERRTELEEQAQQATETGHWHNVISTAAAILADHPDDDVARGHWEMATNVLDRKYRREMKWAVFLIGILLVIGCFLASKEYSRLRALEVQKECVGLENKAEREQVPESWRDNFQKQREQGGRKLEEREFGSALRIFSSLRGQIEKAISANEARVKFEREKEEALKGFETTLFFLKLQKTLETIDENHDYAKNYEGVSEQALDPLVPGVEPASRETVYGEEYAEEGKYSQTLILKYLSVEKYWKYARATLGEQIELYEKCKEFRSRAEEARKAGDFVKLKKWLDSYDRTIEKLAGEPAPFAVKWREDLKLANDYGQNMGKLRHALNDEKWGEVIDFGNTARQNLEKLRKLGADGYATPGKFEEIADATETAKVELNEKCKEFLLLAEEARKAGDFVKLKKWLDSYDRTIEKLAGEPDNKAIEFGKDLELFNEAQESERKGLEYYEEERYTEAEEILQRAIKIYYELNVDDADYAELRHKIEACETMKQLEGMEQDLLHDRVGFDALEDFKLLIRKKAEAGKKKAPSEREKIELAVLGLQERASEREEAIREKIEKIKRIFWDADKNIEICTSPECVLRIQGEARRTLARFDKDALGKDARNQTSSLLISLWKKVERIREILTTAEEDKKRCLTRRCRRKKDDRAKEEISKYSKEARDLAKEHRDVILLETKEEPDEKRSKKKPARGEAWTLPELEMKMVWIKDGTFIMGSPMLEGGRDNDEQQHEVTLTKGYWMGQCEVTQAEYKGVRGANQSRFRGANLPVEKVTWDEAVAFCRELTELGREAGSLPEGYVYRLPTEAEWEYACRAGTTGPYADGQLAELGWYGGNSGSQTHEVGQKRANAWGLYDMHGNVYEWCRDLYGKREYRRGPVRDPLARANGTGRRVLRGGSWYSPTYACRSADRRWNLPMERYPYYGFRAVLAPSQQ